MDAILVSYTALGYNSTNHTLAFAWGLKQLGCRVRVAVASGDVRWHGFTFFECIDDGSLQEFPAGAYLEPADVVHVWTPRAPVWRFLEHYGHLVGRALILHLEDDEDEVLRGFGITSLAREPLVLRRDLQSKSVMDWSHPILTRCLARAADGISLLSPSLSTYVPDDTPSIHVFPPLGPEWWQPLEGAGERFWGSDFVDIVYAGGVHEVIADDFLTLCHAVAQLKKQGVNARLVRSGPPMIGSMQARAANLPCDYLDLGPLPLHQLRRLLTGADVLVQPGRPSAFNMGRMPAKLAPYLLSGTPVVMPSVYRWLGVNHGEHAFLFDEGTVDDIARTISAVLSDRAGAKMKAERARIFARRRFAPRTCCKPLLHFFESVAHATRTPWSLLKRPRIEVPLLLAAMGNTSTNPTPSQLAQFALDEFRHPPRNHLSPTTAAQLFWAGNATYVERSSITRLLPAERWSRLTFGPVPVGSKTQLRLDPAISPGVIEIAAFTYRALDHRLLRQFRAPTDTRPGLSPYGTAIELLSPHPRVWRWLSTGADPQLLLPPPGREGVINVECWMRWSPVE